MPENLREFSRTVGEFAKTGRGVGEVSHLIGIENPKPVRGNTTIEFYEFFHFSGKCE
jgi:hypothetical protein